VLSRRVLNQLADVANGVLKLTLTLARITENSEQYEVGNIT
jgi:hypothetical protein